LPNEWRADQPRSQAFASTVQIVISLNDRTLSLYQSNQHQTTYELAIGQAGWETPTGSFQVEVLQRNPDWTHPITGEYIPPGDRKNPLGTRWIGFFRQGNEEFGIHGTNQEDSIGRAVSHGCLRMRNQDIEALFDQITEGTPVIIRP
jgi:lipoprotein-anchoring transpeptidase ErfK/SrfK